jgi:hypothetical protein
VSKSLTNGLICLVAGVAAVFIALQFGAIGMCGGSIPLLVLLCLGLAAFLAGAMLLLFWAVRGLYRKLARSAKALHS